MVAAYYFILPSMRFLRARFLSLRLGPFFSSTTVLAVVYPVMLGTSLLSEWRVFMLFVILKYSK